MFYVLELAHPDFLTLFVCMYQVWMEAENTLKSAQKRPKFLAGLPPRTPAGARAPDPKNGGLQFTNPPQTLTLAHCELAG